MGNESAPRTFRGAIETNPPAKREEGKEGNLWNPQKSPSPWKGDSARPMHLNAPGEKPVPIAGGRCDTRGTKWHPGR